MSSLAVVTQLPVQPLFHSPSPYINGDESGVRLYIPSDDHPYDLGYMGLWFNRLFALYPNATLDYAEAIKGGVLLDFMNVEAL